jgi:putative holliday junction resolvase
MIRVLGIDYGEARVGVAISDELGMLAHPVETIAVKDTEPVARVAQLMRERGVSTVIVGLPRNMDGSHGPSAEKARTFAEKLRERAGTGCTVRLWDERLTTVAAQKALHAAGKNAKQSKGLIDQAAAVIILQGWLDAQAMMG